MFTLASFEFDHTPPRLLGSGPPITIIYFASRAKILGKLSVLNTFIEKIGFDPGIQ